MERSCPACDSKLVERSLGGVSIKACAGCDAVLVARDDVLQLRELPEGADPLLRRVQPPPGTVEPAWATEPRECPDCGVGMTSFSYRGGSTVVERCASCDQLFFETNELGKVLYEWDHGLEMSEDARMILDAHKAEGMLKRLTKLDALIGSAALVSFYLALRVLQASGHVTHWLAIVPAIAISGGYFFYRQRRLMRAKQRVKSRLVEFEKTTRPATTPKLSKKASDCPWCGAVVPPKTSRCLSCDSDVF